MIRLMFLANAPTEQGTSIAPATCPTIKLNAGAFHGR
jgi:hypothetical protein